MLGARCASALTSDSKRWRDTLRNGVGMDLRDRLAELADVVRGGDGSGGTGLRRGDDRDHGE